MSLKGLQDWGDQVYNLLRRNVADDLQEHSIITLVLTQSNLAKAMHRTITAKAQRRGKTASSGYQHMQASHRKPPTEGQIKRAIKDNAKNLVTDITRLMGASYVTGDLNLPTNQLRITVWNGAGTGVRGAASVSSYILINSQVYQPLKDIFYDLLVMRFGGGSGSHDKFTNRNAMNRGMFNPTNPAGKSAWRQEFQVSHISPTMGEQAGAGVKQAVDQDLAQLATIPSKNDFQRGKNDFLTITEQMMTNVLGTAVTHSVSRGTIRKRSGPTVYLLHGAAQVIVEFDERRAQTAAGLKSKKDIRPLTRIFKKYYNTEMAKLAMSSQGKKTISQLWYMRGSPSTKNVYKYVSEEVTLDNIVRSIKKRPNQKVTKRDKKKVVPKKHSKKKVPTKRVPIKRKTRAKANTMSGPKTKSGSPDMRFTANKQAWGGKGSGSPIGLIQLLNKALPDELRKKMTGVYPRSLEWRTGRFAESARVTNIVPFPNLTQISYTYMKNPYQVFEPESGNPIASSGRDPQQIIGGTIRQIAQSIMGTKFGLVRTKRV